MLEEDAGPVDFAAERDEQAPLGKRVTESCEVSQAQVSHHALSTKVLHDSFHYAMVFGKRVSRESTVLVSARLRRQEVVREQRDCDSFRLPAVDRRGSFAADERCPLPIEFQSCRGGHLLEIIDCDQFAGDNLGPTAEIVNATAELLGEPARRVKSERKIGRGFGRFASARGRGRLRHGIISC